VSVLAIDTSSRSRIVCVLASPEGALIDATVVHGESVGAALPPALARMLVSVDAAVVVVTGPGTYTGVRAGMAAALGLAQARALPLHGVGSLEVINCGIPDSGAGSAWVVADAGRGALYAARTSGASHAVRIALADFDPGGDPVFTADDLPIKGVVTIDPARALARSVVVALARPALDPAGLRAVYVD
jgi:tRNA threonylcarbamoyl adenosine modification protein YeaZ